MVELVIKIDEKTYQDIKAGKVYSSVRDVPLESVNAIANGTPLSKGHGRLIDANKIMTLAHEEGAYDYVSAKEIADAATIIDADNTESEE